VKSWLQRVTRTAETPTLGGMAIFKRTADRRFIDLRDPTVARCPSCNGPSSTDYVDLVLQKSTHTCRRCSRLWEQSPREHARI